MQDDEISELAQTLIFIGAHPTTYECVHIKVKMVKIIKFFRHALVSIHTLSIM